MEFIWFVYILTVCFGLIATLCYWHDGMKIYKKYFLDDVICPNYFTILLAFVPLLNMVWGLTLLICYDWLLNGIEASVQQYIGDFVDEWEEE